MELEDEGKDVADDLHDSRGVRGQQTSATMRPGLCRKTGTVVIQISSGTMRLVLCRKTGIVVARITSGGKTIKKNSTQNKSQTQRARAYKVTSFLSTDCELSTKTCSKNVYSPSPGTMRLALCTKIGMRNHARSATSRQHLPHRFI